MRPVLFIIAAAAIILTASLASAQSASPSGSGTGERKSYSFSADFKSLKPAAPAQPVQKPQPSSPAKPAPKPDPAKTAGAQTKSAGPQNVAAPAVKSAATAQTSPGGRARLTYQVGAFSKPENAEVLKNAVLAKGLACRVDKNEAGTLHRVVVDVSGTETEIRAMLARIGVDKPVPLRTGGVLGSAALGQTASLSAPHPAVQTPASQSPGAPATPAVAAPEKKPAQTPQTPNAPTKAAAAEEAVKPAANAKTLKVEALPDEPPRQDQPCEISPTAIVARGYAKNPPHPPLLAEKVAKEGAKRALMACIQEAKAKGLLGNASVDEFPARVVLFSGPVNHADGAVEMSAKTALADLKKTPVPPGDAAPKM